MLLHGLTENHGRSLLASVQYAAELIRDCSEVLAASHGSDVLSRYTGALTIPQQKIAHDYLHRMKEQLLRAWMPWDCSHHRHRSVRSTR